MASSELVASPDGGVTTRYSSGLPTTGFRCPMCFGHRANRLRTAIETAADLRSALARGDKLMHSYASDIFVCDECGTVFRDPERVPDDLLSHYREDSYSAAELERLWSSGLSDLRRQSGALSSLGLQSNSSILEIGSYVGSFLTLARELGCDAIGVDVGRDVVAFARAKGLCVSDDAFSAERFGPRRFDSVWILNCFEQLPDSPAVLRDVATVLRPAGRVVIRTPNADFIRAAYQSECECLREMLDANGLLGVPFSKCLSSELLVALLADNGFGRFRLRGHELNSRDPSARRPSVSIHHPWMDVSAALVPETSPTERGLEVAIPVGVRRSGGG